MNNTLSSNSLQYYMQLALTEAAKAKAINEVPVGAILVAKNGEIIGRGYNQVIKQNVVTAHAEIVAITKASIHLNNYRLDKLDLFVTLEPCPMCAGALLHARINNIYFGAFDPKGGAIANNAQIFNPGFSYNHKPQWHGGILEAECKSILQDFFKTKRKLLKEKNQFNPN